MAKSSTYSSLGITLLLLAVLCPAAQTQVIAVRAGKLVDPETGSTLLNQTILVEGSKIKAVGPGTQIPVPATATVIDLSNSTVLPGLIDSHTHMCLGFYLHPSGRSSMATASSDAQQPERSIFEAARTLLQSVFLATVLDTTGYRAIQGVANARSMLESGFTTIRDVGNAGNYADTDLRRAIEEGLVPGPTVINAGRIIAPQGGQFPGLMQPEKPYLGNPEYLYADTKDELKKAIRENILYGAKVIKIVVDDHPYIYSVDDIKFVIEESGKAGLRVAAHCWTDKGARNAAEAGVASIEHGPYMTDETLELAKRNNVVLVGTDSTREMTEALGAPWHAVFLDRLKRAHKVGITMAFGSDWDLIIPGKTRGELSVAAIESFVEAGIPSKTILQILITNPARLLGIEKDRGAIKPGMAADIIATPRNPIDDIRALEQVNFVMKDGKVFKHGK